MPILDNLTTKELNQLKSLSDKDFDDGDIYLKVHSSLTGVDYGESDKPDNEKKISGHTLSELSDNNKEIARLLILAVERDYGFNRNDLLCRYLFDKKDPREDELQRALLPDLVKEIRAKTGLSQKKFAEEYDISLKSLEAWESGSKKISKYAYHYLRSCFSDKIDIIKDERKMELPLSILDDDDIAYLKHCCEVDRVFEYECAFVRHVEATSDEGEIYIVEIEDPEIIVDGEIIRLWERDEYPENLQECIRVATKFECYRIWFWGVKSKYAPKMEGSIQEKLEKLLKRNAK